MVLQNTPDAFRQQLREGHFNELRVALYLMLRGCMVRIGYRDERYDIEVHSPRGRRHHVEVKWDKRAGETGNLYFEVENTNQRRSSGIMATSADLWCHVVGEGEEAFLVSVEALRAFLGADPGAFRSVHTRGTDSNSRGLLVPRAALTRCRAGRWFEPPSVEDFFGQIFRAG